MGDKFEVSTGRTAPEGFKPRKTTSSKAPVDLQAQRLASLKKARAAKKKLAKARAKQ